MKKIVYVFLILMLFSCSTTKITVDLASNVIEEGIEVFFEEEDLDLARKSLESNLKLLEILNRAESTAQTLSTLSKAYGGFTFIFLEKDLLFEKDTNKKEIIKQRVYNFYTRGKNFGLASLYKENPKIEKSISSNNLEELEKQLLNIYNKEALLWTAFNWGLLINQDKSSVENIASIPKVKLIIDRLIKLDKEYFQATPLALKAALSCITPKMLGGKADEGVKLLEEGLNLTNRNFYVFHQIYIEHCIAQIQDKETFKLLVKEIKDGNLNLNKNFILINKSVKEKIPLIEENIQRLLID